MCVRTCVCACMFESVHMFMHMQKNVCVACLSNAKWQSWVSVFTFYFATEPFIVASEWTRLTAQELQGILQLCWLPSHCRNTGSADGLYFIQLFMWSWIQTQVLMHGQVPLHTELSLIHKKNDFYLILNHSGIFCLIRIIKFVCN